MHSVRRRTMRREAHAVFACALGCERKLAVRLRLRRVHWGASGVSHFDADVDGQSWVCLLDTSDAADE